ncbi:MAG: hypothetical protein ACYC9R_06295 [Nitrosotalea sp.]
MRAVNPNPNLPKFIHIRYHDGEGRILNQGGITIAYRDSVEHSDSVEVAFSKCIWYDNFNRKIGRTIATGHLKYYRFYLMSKPEDEKELYNDIIGYVTNKVDAQEEAAQVAIDKQGATIH